MSEIKKELVPLVVNELKFKSKMLWNKPYKYSNLEENRYHLWLHELHEYLMENHELYIMEMYMPNVKKWDSMVCNLNDNGKEYCVKYFEHRKLHKDIRYNSRIDAIEAGLLEAVKLILKQL